MTWLTSLQQAIAYIEQHLLEDLTMTQIAQVGHSSEFHFQRAFSLLTGMTVNDYIRRRRLTLAAEELQRTEAKVIDVAFKYGYETPEAFTKAFRRQHGISPIAVRQAKGKITSYYPLTIEIQLKGVEPMNYQVKQKEAFQVVGIVTTMKDNSGISALWNQLNANGTTARLAQLNNGDVQGLLGVCLPHAEGIQYVIGVAYQGDVPEDFEMVEVPASTWAVFEVIGAMPHAMTNAWQRIYKEWLPSSQYELAGTAEFELYTEDDPFDDKCYSEIWIPVK
ncbi:AraC family transcriptional regulator [Lysinibacillus piscis]|uniref:AraC family transcriptional regulator n=1 Tax=Lysinibacillus piscis TaxID=2518931 RepID=A0ABQ5NNI7_9BACI|nr:AraC family transcriptional regulator [Lysinibacillus sp. KH24]GLC89647.1 AraC family transcriptional regulator [Lysinibacillus sp. KH24]